MITTVTAAASPPATPPVMHRWTGPLRLMVTVAAGGLAIGWPAVAGPYAVSVAATALVFAVLAVSTQLVVGVAGLPTFAQGAYFGVGAYTAALLADAGHTVGVEQLAAAGLAAGLAGALSAPLLLRTRGTRFLMATFAVQSLTATAASQWRSLTGGDEGLHVPPVIGWPGGPALTSPAYLYWYVLAVTALLAALLTGLCRSRLMLVLRGVAGHEPRMTALGHPVTAELTAGYTVAAALAGVAGALLVAVNQYVSPADLSVDVAALTVLAAAIGAGSLTGAAAGAILIVAVRDGAGISSGGASPLLLGLLFIAVAYRVSALRAIAGVQARILDRSQSAGSQRRCQVGE